MKVYTRKGDNGEADLMGGIRAHKGDDRFHTLGDLDELNAWMGLAKCVTSEDERAFIEQIQGDLGTMMAHIAALGSKALEQHPFPAGLDTELEKRIDALSKDEEIFSFTLPGVNESSACVNAARTIARRAERSVCTLAWEYPITHDVLKYMNRLSDYLFVLGVNEAKKGERK